MDFTSAYLRVVTKLDGWLESFVNMLPNLVVAALVLVLFWLVALVVTRMARKRLRKLGVRPSI